MGVEGASGPVLFTFLEVRVGGGCVETWALRTWADLVLEEP